MADQPYTEADVERVAEALKASNVKRWETGKPVPAWCDLATAALDALAAAGRLLPEGAGSAECGCPITVEVARVTRHTRECGNNKAAARLAAHIVDEYGSTDE
jgi:hypothetical protein